MNKLSSVKAKLAMVPVLALGVMAAAHAELPASVAATATKATTDANAIFDLVFPVVGAVVGLTVVIKLFKRFIAKI